MDVRTKRVYEEPARGDGFRVLVDRVWPRGLSKERAAVDDWQRELAPSTELRQWFGHRPERFEGFRERYLEELQERRGRLSRLRGRARREPVTLLYAARDRELNQAQVLAGALRRGLPRRRPPATAGGGRR